MSVTYPVIMLFHILHLDQFQTYKCEIFVYLLHIPLGEQICFYLTLSLCFKPYKPTIKAHSIQGSPIIVYCITPPVLV
jgi:hypothetical protein